MKAKKSTIIKIAVAGMALNALFGLYNIKNTKKVFPLTKKQSSIVLLLNSLSTSIGFIHLAINKKIGAYKKGLECE